MKKQKTPVSQMPDNSLCNKPWDVWPEVLCTLSLGHDSGHYHNGKKYKVWWIGDKERERQSKVVFDSDSR